MLSNLIISTQRFVFVIDELGHEKIAEKFICQLLREQGQDESTTKTLPVNEELKREATFTEFANFCANSKEHKWNVLLPAFSDLICFQRPAVVFQFLDRLSKCGQVQRIFLWASRCHLMHPQAVYLVSACEYMADLVLHLETSTELSIVTRKPGGGVTNKRYTCQRSKKEFLVEPVKSTRKSPEESSTVAKPEQLGTFKIELDEDELVARNALKLPYEKTSEAPEGNIIYTPDADDDFDDEDPDEDLCI